MGRIYGARYGVRGIVNEDFVNLSAETQANLEAVAATPSSALGSTRDKPDLAYSRNILASLKAHGAAWFLYIGGNAWSAMRPCGAGARNSARRLPATCATAGHGPGTSGTSMRSSSSSSENRGVQHDLWRAVDQDGVVLDILVQDQRDFNAARRFFRRLLKGLQYVPRVIVTDKLGS